MRTVFEILRPPPLRHKRFSWCEEVEYKRSVAAMAQTTIISNQEQNFKHSAASHRQEEHQLQAESSNNYSIDHRSTMEKHYDQDENFIEQQPGRTLRTSQQDHRAATRTRREEHSTKDIWSLKADRRQSVERFMYKGRKEE